VLIAWTGALAFAASLLYLVYFFVVVLGSTSGDPHERVRHIAINAALFAAFALHHSLFARSAVKRLVTTIIPGHLERSSFVWSASALTFVMCLLWQPVAGSAYEVEGAWRALFWSVQILGVVVVIRAARVISALDLAGVDQARGRHAAASLKVVGPFRVVRHPIYLGWFLMVFGTPAMTANRLLFATLSAVYLILAIPWEEKSLGAAHGDRYRAYQRAVRWRLIPLVW
jgi:protein-S-isoprenylcysteine O-methyltransferase Ste14